MPRVESRYATRVPSGDQLPSNSGPAGFVASGTTSDPSGFIAKRSSKLSATIRPERLAISIGVPTTTGVWLVPSMREGSGDGVGAGVDPGADDGLTNPQPLSASRTLIAARTTVSFRAIACSNPPLAPAFPPGAG